MLTRALREVRKNLVLKLFSVLLAVGLWVYVINTEDPVRKESLDRPVEVVAVPQGLAVVRVRPERVKVQLEGRVSGLQPAALSQLRVVADLSEAGAGPNTVALTVMGVPDRVSAPQIDRPNVHVWLDQQFGKNLNIDVTLSGKPAKGSAVLGKATARPSTAGISGPEGAVERVARLVARVDIDGASQRKTASAEVEALDARGMPVAGVTLEPAKVTVVVPIATSETKRVQVRARIGKAAEGFRATDVRTTPRSVLVKGAPDAIEGLSEIATEWQGIARQGATTTTYQVPLAFPAGVWPAEGVRSVEVEVTIAPIAETTTPAATAGPSSAASGPPEEGKAGAGVGQGPDAAPGPEEGAKAPPGPAEPDGSHEPAEGTGSRPGADAAGVPDEGDNKGTARPRAPGSEPPQGGRPRPPDAPKGQPKARPDAAGDGPRASETAKGAGAKPRPRSEARGVRQGGTGGKATP